MKETMLNLTQKQMNFNRGVSLFLMFTSVLATTIMLSQGSYAFWSISGIIAINFFLWLAHASYLDRANRYRGLFESIATNESDFDYMSMDIGKPRWGDLPTLWTAPESWVFIVAITALTSVSL